ncbi:uncharacterized protein LOC110464187 [Mizuhopecten yessoensis]|uniref:Uncharacterized protein n=1 Tax=Mizuhopecten yessoensis TaxID=6573 RepID=A0A210PUF8_MIZYE|nr:uncharacterized protein LOC110464187 [Mizuhopecten yessoensis]OWF40123.1 hypothetical protein KP79_PYT05911 [Mizuhopecten yessoensis]
MITANDQQLFPNMESFKGIHPKKTMKDKCKVIGETTMYYSNAGSVQVLSPIPGSPSPDSEPWSDRIRPDCPKRTSLISFDRKDKVKKTMSGKKISSKKTTKRSDYSLPPITNVPTTGLSKKMVDRNQKTDTSTEACKPINMPSFRAGRGSRKVVTKGSNPSVPVHLFGQESVARLTAGPKMIQATSRRTSILSVKSVRLPVPRGPMRTPTSIKFLPSLYRDSLPSLRVQAMVVQ